jgi:hypothetical protein
MSEGIQAISGILAAIIGLAIVAVIVSNNANTSNVINAGGTAFSGLITAAVSPVSGAGASANSILSGTTGLGGIVL